jgi:hypothetical protein
MRRVAAIVTVAAGLLAGPARAEAPPPPSSGTVPGPEARRSAASFRGREEGDSAAHALAWIPRIVFSPLYVLTELVLRRPLYAFLGWADRNHVFDVVDRVLNPFPGFNWYPTLQLDLGVFFLPGVEGRWNDAFVRRNELRFSGAVGGENFWYAMLVDRFHVGPVYFGGQLEFVTRPERAFYGLGPDSPSQRMNFSQTRLDTLGLVGFEPGKAAHLELAFGYREETVGPGNPPSVGGTDGTLPEGFVPLSLLLASARLELDSRTSREHNGGARFVASTTYARDVKVPGRAFVTGDVDLRVGVEIRHPDRVLSARLYVADSFPLGNEPVPITHMPLLGWQNHMGFVWGRFRGESAIMGELRYRYPVGHYMDFQCVGSAGNVFARDFHDFDFGALTASIGVGLRTRRTSFLPLEMMIGMGSSRFDEAFAIESVRLFVSTDEGP